MKKPLPPPQTRRDTPASAAGNKVRSKSCRVLTELCVGCAGCDPAAGTQGFHKQLSVVAPGGVGSMCGDGPLCSHKYQPQLKTNMNNTRNCACYKRHFHVVCLGQTGQMDPLPLSSLLPPEKDLGRYYRYEGSLTTPDCYEGVIWTIFEKPVELSVSQVSHRRIAWKICWWLFALWLPAQSHNLTQTC